MKKRKPGRQKLGRVKFTTTLPPRIVEALRVMGAGNASQAIIALVEAELKDPVWKDWERK